MMIKYEDLVKVNENLPKVDVKGKQYAMVNERVKAFRQICPTGTIMTEIISMENGVVTMKATVMDGDLVLATGLAQEKEQSSFINKTSYIENCETSAVGRALGFVGIGVDGSMASAEEVANAIMNQNNNQGISEKEAKILREMIKNAGLDVKDYLAKFKVSKWSEINQKMRLDMINDLKSME